MNEENLKTAHVEELKIVEKDENKTILYLVIKLPLMSRRDAVI